MAQRRLDRSIPTASGLIPQHHNCFRLVPVKAENLPMLHTGFLSQECLRPPRPFSCPFLSEGKKSKIMTRNPKSSCKVQKSFQETDSPLKSILSQGKLCILPWHSPG